jgi:hypothetical protein
MRSNRSLWSIAVSVALGMVIALFSTSWGQGRDNYQTQTKVYATPEYKTDTTRAIDAYEKVMERYMDAAERNFTSVSSDLKAVSAKLTALETKLTGLDARLARIEKHLGVGMDPNAPNVVPQAAKPQGVVPASASVK